MSTKGEGLHVAGDTLVHDLPAHPKVLACIAFVVVVVATPTGRWSAFAGYAALILGVLALSRIPPLLVLRRMVVEVPFVVLRAAAAVRRARAAGRRARAVAVVRGLLGGATMLAKGDARRARRRSCWRRHTGRVDLLRRPPPAAGAAACWCRSLASCCATSRSSSRRLRRMRMARTHAVSRAAPAARPARSRRRRRRAVRPRRTSAGSGCTWRCCRRGYTGAHAGCWPAGRPAEPAALALCRLPLPPLLVAGRRGVSGGRRRCAGESHAVRVEAAFAYPDGRQVLFGVDLEVRPGERVALLGPNGAGKTTLVLHLNGILGGRRARTAGSRRRAAGRHRDICARSAGGSGSCSRTRTTSCSCRRSPTTWRSARRTSGCAAPSSTRGSRRRWRRSGMSEVADRPPHHLSFGQRRRVAVATVLAMRPGGAGARRAVQQPRPGQPARAGRHADRPRRDRADGHARPAVRARSCARVRSLLDGDGWSPTARPASCSPTRS